MNKFIVDGKCCSGGESICAKEEEPVKTPALAPSSDSTDSTGDVSSGTTAGVSTVLIAAAAISSMAL